MAKMLVAVCIYALFSFLHPCILCTCYRLYSHADTTIASLLQIHERLCISILEKNVQRAYNYEKQIIRTNAAVQRAYNYKKQIIRMNAAMDD